ncbi:HdeD family acid-resistance protein [Microbacterium gorillae]|uniref:HdeD family acid-resistance protein n=1 Tax=Microbacterium gorillae TaxID=1231063 RepID=UPI0005911C55|nr:DUF308 domain-containing protein [Microbacterium gorillae]
MTDTDIPTGSPSSVRGALRLWLGIASALALITGIVVLVWPAQSLTALTVILAVYALIEGLLYVIVAFTSKMGGWARIGHIIAGLLFIVAAIVAFMNPASTALILAYFVVVFLGISWIFEGIAALTTLSVAPAKGWAIFFAIVSILGGIALLFAPMTGATVLLIWLGVTLVVMGIVGLIRAVFVARD